MTLYLTKASVHVSLFFLMPCINFLTYLLIYFHSYYQFISSPEVQKYHYTSAPGGSIRECVHLVKHVHFRSRAKTAVIPFNPP